MPRRAREDGRTRGPAVWDLPSLQPHEIKEIRPTGNYAIQLVWGDGHAEGIWSWRYLGSLR